MFIGKHVVQPVFFTSLSDPDNLILAAYISYDRILWQTIFPQSDDLDSVGLVFMRIDTRDSVAK